MQPQDLKTHTFIVVLTLLSTACATPRPIKNAAQLQLQAISEAKGSVAAYADLADKILEKTEELKNQSDAAVLAASKVDEALRDETKAGDPVKASDHVAEGIFALRRQQRQQATAIAAFRQAHRKNLTDLQNILELLRLSQELITEFLLTDIGPTQEQLGGLREKILGLREALGDGGEP